VKPHVLICDDFRTHERFEILEFCLKNNVILCRPLSYTSHKLQHCDFGVFATLMIAYHNQDKRLNRGGVDKLGKDHFTSLYKPAQDKALTKRLLWPDGL
jgi:hypothetical protein